MTIMSFVPHILEPPGGLLRLFPKVVGNLAIQQYFESVKSKNRQPLFEILIL